MAEVLAPAATVLAAMVAGFIAWWINRATDRRRAANERELQILKALEFLTGGTQKRSAGIGLLEGLFVESGSKSHLRSVFLPVIRNQLVYLATSSSSKREIHEHDNFFRLADLWNRLEPDERDNEPLRDALKLRREQEDGLEFSDRPYKQKFETFCKVVLGPTSKK